jgi:hypothetical protein
LDDVRAERPPREGQTILLIGNRGSDKLEIGRSMITFKVESEYFLVSGVFVEEKIR